MSIGSSSTSPQAQTDEEREILVSFEKWMADDKYPPPLAAIMALTDKLESRQYTTTTELLTALSYFSNLLLTSPSFSFGLRAGAAIFERWVRDTVGTVSRSMNLEEMKSRIVKEGREFAGTQAKRCRDLISAQAEGFLRDGSKVLIHGYSRVVIATLVRAHENNKRLSVYVTEARPSNRGWQTHKVLAAEGIPCTLIPDSNAAYILSSESIDVVMVGAEAVAESGGVIAGVGTYQLALLSSALRKPFYALAESYKFIRLFPLSQSDLQQQPEAQTHTSTPTTEGEDGTVVAGGVKYDYTPRENIALIMSDVGVLTPESVSAYLVNVFTD